MGKVQQQCLMYNKLSFEKMWKTLLTMLILQHNTVQTLIFVSFNEIYSMAEGLDGGYRLVIFGNILS